MKKLMKKLVALVCLCVAFVATPVFADFQEGYDAYLEKDYKTALRELRPLAEQGNAEAQFYMGNMYNNGRGVSQDYKQAAKWYTLSAEQGDDHAQFNLAMLYYNGEGVPQDYKQAVKWYTLSAEQGDAEAQTNLGVMYALGQGVPQDYLRAHMWGNLGASNGNENGIVLRDLAVEQMTRSQIEKAQDLARACVAKDYKGC